MYRHALLSVAIISDSFYKKALYMKSPPYLLHILVVTRRFSSF